MAVSGAKMLVQTTVAVLVLCVLSSSYQVQQYRVVKSGSGEVLCAASPPNKTIDAVGTRGKCTIECSRGCGSPCQAVNYRQTTQLCELFYYEPCLFDVQPDCIFSQVVDNIDFPTMIKIADPYLPVATFWWTRLNAVVVLMSNWYASWQNCKHNVVLDSGPLAPEWYENMTSSTEQDI